MNFNNFELATHRLSFLSNRSAFHKFFRARNSHCLYFPSTSSKNIDFFLYFRQFCEANNREYYKYNEFLDDVETYETADVAVLK